jgi:hypothetical protein
MNFEASDFARRLPYYPLYLDQDFEIEPAPPREVEARARMSTLQRDELLTQSEILDKETSPPAQEAN